ncbi:glycosyltransferase family 4 protein [Neobacillus drentensis]|uniref:glycosyltransferase family 4 protein n=1 Tax=Neobacillus drentensis TaxID=220684 RepID=UPI0030024CD7
MKRALMLASVASMIDQFNMNNIAILQDLGYRVDVATNLEFGSSTSQERVYKFKQELLQQKINPFHIPFPRQITNIKNMFSAYKIVRKLINQNQYEIIHCHSPIGGVIARLASMSARRKGTRVLYTAHGFHFFHGAPKQNWLIFYPIEKICARFTDCLITINTEDFLQATSKKFPAKRIMYVPGVGINSEGIKQVFIDKSKKKAEFGIKDECVLLSVGELNDNKNHEVIINALVQIDRPIKYILCGKGEKLDYLKNLTKELNIEDKVIFTGFRTDISEIMHICDIFCFPSYREGLSVALMEAMASGLPIVCSEIRGNVDLVKDQKGGYLLNPDDVNAFGKRIEKLVNDKELRISMGQFNMDYIKEYDFKIVNKNMESIYKECIQENGAN